MLSPAFRQRHTRSSDDHARRALTEGLRLHPITAAVPVVRDALSNHQGSLLFDERSTGPDPFSLTVMELDADRIHRAVIQTERSLVYTGYDAVGTFAAQGSVLNAFGYGMGSTREFAEIDHVDVARSLETNTWDGTEEVRPRTKDVRPRQCEKVGSC